ncbi:PREDICTED: prostaglandin E synthase 3 [Nicrophorus vespilloides]|uniref:Prostaglandin E synthase 3 n=1 Tax=Nicrophorus vespilloides TaxID=110193 RepID=A0ABM1NCS9_NICVS|nr:PREDICTED: prostaglandin E synthase 3 [Nicrophorus vespilloides]
MTEQSNTLPPPIMWAQRSSVVFLTINLEDVNDPIIKFEKDSLYFKGIGGADKKNYEIKISLYKDIDPEKSNSFNRGRCIEIVLTKANTEDSYWPSLTTGSVKHHWLKSDFNKWHDEDDSEDEGAGQGYGDFQDMMKKMGGLYDGGDGKPSLDDLDMGEADSDDEPLPDLE